VVSILLIKGKETQEVRANNQENNIIAPDELVFSLFFLIAKFVKYSIN
jgi:hypothetical protein